MKQLKGIRGESYFEFFTDRDPGGNLELQSVHDISLDFGTNAANRIKVDLAGFKNALGKSVADVILQQWDKVEAMLAEQDRTEAEEFALDRAELEGLN